jgi:hypothetical protein
MVQEYTSDHHGKDMSQKTNSWRLCLLDYEHRLLRHLIALLKGTRRAWRKVGLIASSTQPSHS